MKVWWEAAEWASDGLREEPEMAGQHMHKKPLTQRSLDGFLIGLCQRWTLYNCA